MKIGEESVESTSISVSQTDWLSSSELHISSSSSSLVESVSDVAVRRRCSGFRMFMDLSLSSNLVVKEIEEELV